ncbi:peptidylprolyl isomerase [Nocardioides sp. SR21]|uniref:peptidylprolyl isomerase n=1 Tax=Nocardioides sp. SR21 TaxID=2919501 RepID=UPI001FAA17DF|nr:peptidylprolyl isomerase [Nocardioides sp. SR21]
MLVRTAALALTTVLALAGCSGSDESSDASASDPAPTTGVECLYPADTQGASKEVEQPSQLATETGTVEVTLATSAGDIGLELDADATPCTVHSFVSLAEQGYFDGTTCHRLTTPESGIAVLQCGDPTGTGTGGPGYSFEDELTGDETYPAGTLAMANAGPNTNGSQFFIVYGDTPLPASYTVFGTVDEDGLAVVQEIGDAGTTTGAPDGPPATPVDIESATVEN